MKKLVTSLLLPCLALFADGEHVTQQLTGGATQINSGGEVINRSTTSGIYNYDEVTYEHIKKRSGVAHQPQESSSITLGENIIKRKQEELSKRIASAAEQKKVAEAKATPTWPKFTEGYCYVKNDTEVERIATYAYLSCDFAAPIGRAELVASLVPDFYARALVAKPLYLNIMDNNRKKQRIPIDSGAVLTQNKLSINVANVVNDRKLEKIVASGTYVTLNAATQQSQLYLNDLRQSRQHQSVSQNSSISGTTIASATNYDKPVAGDYLLSGGLQIVSEIAKIVGEAVVNNLPYTFKINKDSVLYADLELSDTAALRGFDPQVPNIIKKQPTYDIATGKEQGAELTSVPIRPTKMSNQYGQTTSQPIQQR